MWCHLAAQTLDSMVTNSKVSCVSEVFSTCASLISAKGEEVQDDYREEEDREEGETSRVRIFASGGRRRDSIPHSQG